MINDFDSLLMFQEVRDYITEHGPDNFLKYLALFHPVAGQALTSAVLHEHAHDYDKKKAALLKNAR